MKKTYIHPQIQIQELEPESTILCGSDMTIEKDETEIEGGEALSQKKGFWDSNFWNNTNE